MLEATQHGDNTFATLTYNEGHKPLCNSLIKKDTQDFLKRLRTNSSYKIRYFLVGEYGDLSQRPHYHAVLFGYPTCKHGQTSYTRYRLNCCSSCDFLSDTWGKGRIHLGEVTHESIQYVCGYVTKKMTNKNDPRLLGRPPEFATMSLRPGIGLGFMHEVASTYLSFDLETRQADVPVSLTTGGKNMPLGRYLRGKLRTMVGHDEKAPQSAPNEYQKKMQNMLMDKVEAARKGSAFWSLSTLTKEIGETRAKSLEFKYKLYPKKGQQ